MSLINAKYISGLEDQTQFGNSVTIYDNGKQTYCVLLKETDIIRVKIVGYKI